MLCSAAGFALCFLVASCEKMETASSDFARLYAELRIAEVEFGDAEIGAVERQKIFERHNTNSVEFENKLDIIKKNVDGWKIFQNSVIAVLDTLNLEQTLTKED